MIISYNPMAAMINRQMGITEKSRAVTAGRLSSGLRINSAADDAAGLAISEKMRSQIRGLERGTANVTDGISWIQTGEGALSEMTNLMQRMRELTVYALNDTQTDLDRANIQTEFDQLQSELDALVTETQFNTNHIFMEHEPTYHTIEGNRFWDQGQRHTISPPDNTLTVKVTKSEGESPISATITIPAGNYTTHELMDKIDDAMVSSGADDLGINLEYTKNGLVNLNFEGGAIIDEISGGLQYLIYDAYSKSSSGALLGTTVFTENSRLTVTNANNELSFTLVDSNEVEKDISLTLPTGFYTKTQLINRINEALAAQGVSNAKAMEYGASNIQIVSEDCLVTGFKGNMFKIDVDGEQIYTSVFYDNIKYGNVVHERGFFLGGAVLAADESDTEHNMYKITSANNTLIIRANDAEDYVTIKIPPKDYSAANMVKELNDAFYREKLGITADTLDGEYEGSNGLKTFLKGIRLDSTVSGLKSKIEIDSTSSAYDTLFIKSAFASFEDITPVYGEYDAPFVTSAGTFPSGFDASTDNSFKLYVKVYPNMNEQEYTVGIPAEHYATIDDLITELNNNIPTELDEKIKFEKNSSDNLVLSGISGGNVTSIRVAAHGVNGGYSALFEAEGLATTSASFSSSKGTETTVPQLELNFSTMIPPITKIDDSNKNFTFYIDGDTKGITVELQTGDLSDILDAIATEIEESLKPTPGEVYKPFDTGTHRGTQSHVIITKYGGGDLLNPFDEFDRGEGGIQGQTSGGIPASIVLPDIPLDTNNKFKIHSGNSQLICYVNGESVPLDLLGSNKELEFTLAELAKHIQNKFDEYFAPDERPSVDVTTEGNSLRFTTEIESSSATLQMGYYNSGSFISHLCYKPQAQATIAKTMNETIVIDKNMVDNKENTFNFEINKVVVDADGNSSVEVETVSVELDEDEYDAQSFVDHLNDLFKKNGYGVTADLSEVNSYLRLTTTEVWGNAKISIDTSKLGINTKSAVAIFKNIETPASCTVFERVYVYPYSYDRYLPVEDSFVIDSDTNTFSYYKDINGNVETIELDPGDYTPSKLVEELNKKFNEKDVKAKASIDPSTNYLTLTTVDTGPDAFIGVRTNIEDSSAMGRIFGISKSGIEATIEGGKLILKGTEKGADREFSVSIPTGTVPAVAPPNYTNNDDTVDQKVAYINGIEIVEPVKISDVNNTLTFNYGNDVPPKEVSITIPTNNDGYSFTELEGIIQTQVNNSTNGVGSDKLLKVTVSADGVRIEALKMEYGESDLSDFGGGFYNYVMRGTILNEDKKPTGKDGTQTVSQAFAIGRQDVRNNSVEIIKGTNDELSFDISINDGTEVKSKTVKIILDEGEFVGDALLDMIAKNLPAALETENFPGDIVFPREMVSVSIGGFNSGVAGSNDSNALQFYIPKDYAFDNPGQYIIDGVSGSASYFVFYKTEGEMVPSYTTGTKDISKGVIIEEGKNDFSFTANGVKYTYTIPENVYTQAELLDTLNYLIENESTPSPPDIRAVMSGNNIKLTFGRYGKNTISGISGAARSEIFYSESGTIDARHDILIQVSAKANDLVSIDKPRIDSTGLRINSVVVTNIEQANKALTRIDEALIKVVETREYFGARQNRFDHIRNSNSVTAQNLAQSESRIRDADMAKEMMRLTKTNILSQTAQPLLAQANSSVQNVLRLLNQ
jgi:flagellin-like hook-associated protein FlgL